MRQRMRDKRQWISTHLIKEAEGLIPRDSTRKAMIKEGLLAHQILQEKPLL